MELKEFVIETISSLADAVGELQEKYKEQGVIINPPTAQSGSDVMQLDSSNYTFRRVQNIQFDVAVTVSSETKKEGAGGLKLGIQVVSASLGGEAAQSNSSSQVSHVKFEVPIAYQPSAEETKHREKRDRDQEEFLKAQKQAPKNDWLAR